MSRRNKKNRKLTLGRETLKKLQDSALDQAQGGIARVSHGSQCACELTTTNDGEPV